MMFLPREGGKQGSSAPDPTSSNMAVAWQSGGFCLEEFMRGLAWPFGKAVPRVSVRAQRNVPRVAHTPHPNTHKKVELYPQLGTGAQRLPRARPGPPKLRPATHSSCQHGTGMNELAWAPLETPLL